MDNTYLISERYSWKRIPRFLSYFLELFGTTSFQYVLVFARVADCGNNSVYPASCVYVYVCLCLCVSTCNVSVFWISTWKDRVFGAKVITRTEILCTILFPTLEIVFIYEENITILTIFIIWTTFSFSSLTQPFSTTNKSLFLHLFIYIRQNDNNIYKSTRQ